MLHPPSRWIVPSQTQGAFFCVSFSIRCASTQDPAYPELSAWTDNAAEEVRTRAAAAAEAAAAVQAAAGDLSHAAPPGVPAETLAVDLSAAQYYVEAGAAAAALGISVDVFAACPHWIGGWVGGWVGRLGRHSFVRRLTVMVRASHARHLACFAVSLCSGVMPLSEPQHPVHALSSCTNTLFSCPCLPAGLQMIEPLASATGGTLLLYSSLEAAALPQVCLPRLPLCGACCAGALLLACFLVDTLLVVLSSCSVCRSMHRAASCFDGVAAGRVQERVAAAGLPMPGAPAHRAGAASAGRARPPAARQVCVGGGLGSEGLFLALPGWLVVSAPSCASVQQGLLHIICTILYATLFCSEHANLWSLVACGPDDALSFSLDRSSARASCTAPVVQLVIQYSQLVPVAPAAGGGGAAAAPGTR